MQETVGHLPYAVDLKIVSDLGVDFDGWFDTAAVAVPHSKWNERPVLTIVPVARGAPDPAEIMSLLEKCVAKWQ